MGSVVVQILITYEKKSALFPKLKNLVGEFNQNFSFS